MQVDLLIQFLGNVIVKVFNMIMHVKHLVYIKNSPI